MASVLQPALYVRDMRRSDLSAVVAIEEESYPFPWTRGIFADCLRVGYRGHVLMCDEALSGYAMVSMAVDEAHLLNLCVAPAFRRRGLASVLLDQVLREVRVAAKDRVFLEVRPSNRAALGLYRRYGFREIGRRPGYYPAVEGREDARVMVLHLDPSDE